MAEKVCKIIPVDKMPEASGLMEKLLGHGFKARSEVFTQGDKKFVRVCTSVRKREMPTAEKKLKELFG